MNERMNEQRTNFPNKMQTCEAVHCIAVNTESANKPSVCVAFPCRHTAFPFRAAATRDRESDRAKRSQKDGRSWLSPRSRGHGVTSLLVGLQSIAKPEAFTVLITWNRDG